MKSATVAARGADQGADRGRRSGPGRGVARRTSPCPRPGGEDGCGALGTDSNVGFDPEAPGRRFHAVLLDIDHTPRHVLHPSHSAFYTPAGLGKLVGHLHPGGVFALWSDDPPDPDFEAILAQVFDRSEASVVRFPNPLTGGYSTNTVYVAR
jgi:hypothetical protein